jgi:hypothetical protein
MSEDPGGSERGNLTLQEAVTILAAPLWHFSNSLAPTVRSSMGSPGGVRVSAKVVRCRSKDFGQDDIHDLYSEAHTSGLSRQAQ